MKELKSFVKESTESETFCIERNSENTPLSSKIHCCAKNRIGMVYTYNGTEVTVRVWSFVLKASPKLVRKQGKVYLSSKHKRRGYLGGVRYQNMVLSEYLNQEALRPIRFLNFINQKPEIDDRYFLIAENRNQKSENRENGNQKSEIGNQKSEIRNRKSEIRNQKSENGKRKSEIRNQKSVCPKAGMRQVT